MPTGTALRDVRDQLFDAAERIILRDGVGALTSRAVTSEAGVAKGVLHRHFDDFDDFLASLITDRTQKFAARLDGLEGEAGSRPVPEILTDVVTDLFTSVAGGIVGLYFARDELRRRLRTVYPTGFPMLSDAGTAVAGYLEAERELGRVAAETDVSTVALTLIGTSHLVFAGQDDGAPERAEVVRMVTSVVAGALT